MIFQLIRKDFLLVRKYVCLMMVFSAIAPPLLLWNMHAENAFVDFYGMMIFFLVLFVIVLFLSNSVSLIDETYKKGCAYLCTTPYGRNQIVLSKYAFSYMIFAFYCIIYGLTSLVVPKYTISLTFENIAISFFIVSIFRCVLIPLEFKFGYEKAKYIITMLIIGMPFITSIFFDSIDITKIDFSKIANMDSIWRVALVAILVIVNVISMALSCYVFKKKDL